MTFEYVNNLSGCVLSNKEKFHYGHLFINSIPQVHHTWYFQQSHLAVLEGSIKAPPVFLSAEQLKKKLFRYFPQLTHQVLLYCEKNVMSTVYSEQLVKLEA